MNKFIISIFSIVFLAACDGGSDIEELFTAKGSVSGFVSGSDTGAVLKDATVTIMGKEFTTGADGAFDIKGIDSGSQTIISMKTGYAAYSSNVTITDDQNTTHDIVLESVVATSKLSCLEILNSNLSQGNGIYKIDADGTGPLEPFEVYCDMTNEGGGWTLFANHADGIAKIKEIETVTLTEFGVVDRFRWKALRDGITSGMLFIDELGNISTMNKDKLLNANCRSINDMNDLSSLVNNTTPVNIDRKYLLHNEIGCDGTGENYTTISLLGDTTSNYDVTGASLFQGSDMKFDIWPYSNSFSSYLVQEELLYFIK